MATAPFNYERFSIGRVFSRMFSQITSTFATVGVFVVVVELVAIALSYIAGQQLVATMAHLTPTDPGARPDPMAALAVFTSPAYWGLIVASVVLAVFGLAGSTRGFLASGTGSPVSIGECFQAAATKFFPLLVLYILWGLGVLLGYILIIIPALILVTMWSVAVPVFIGEETGIFAAFGRSRELTKGSRWSIFGILFIFVVVLYVFVFGAMFAMMGSSFGSMFGAGAGSPAAMQAQMSVTAMPLKFVTALVSGLATPSLLVSIYRELRLVNEGDGPNSLRDVFA